MPIIDLTGQRFGRLTVIHTEEKRYTKDNRLMRLCRCDCGNVIFHCSKSLKKGVYPNCGDNCKLKKCPTCKKDKLLSDYHKLSNSRTGVQPYCKECTSLFYTDNKDTFTDRYNKARKDPKVVEKMRFRSKRYRNNNKDKEKAYKKIYEQTDEHKIRKKQIHAYRKQNDPTYNIKRRLRWRVRDIAKRIGGKSLRYESSLVVLGCDVETLKKHLESNFTEGMSWYNMDRWHIDHIKPCNEFDLTKYEDQLVCFNFKNLQPLWQVDNLKKGHSWNKG